MKALQERRATASDISGKTHVVPLQVLAIAGGKRLAAIKFSPSNRFVTA